MEKLNIHCFAVEQLFDHRVQNMDNSFRVFSSFGPLVVLYWASCSPNTRGEARNLRHLGQCVIILIFYGVISYKITVILKGSANGHRGQRTQLQLRPGQILCTEYCLRSSRLFLSLIF